MRRSPYCNPAENRYNMDRRPTALMQKCAGSKSPFFRRKPSVCTPKRAQKSEEDQHETQTCKTACSASGCRASDGVHGRLRSRARTACQYGQPDGKHPGGHYPGGQRDHPDLLAHLRRRGRSPVPECGAAALGSRASEHQDRSGPSGRRPVPRDDRHLVRHRHEPRRGSR